VEAKRVAVPQRFQLFSPVHSGAPALPQRHSATANRELERFTVPQQHQAACTYTHRVQPSAIHLLGTSLGTFN